MSARLKTGIWVRAVLRRMSSDGSSAMILKKGDEDAGAVLILLHDREGKTAILRENGPDWVRAALPEDQNNSLVLQDYLERQKHYDPDLWIIELDVRSIETPLERTLGSRQLDLDNAS